MSFSPQQLPATGIDALLSAADVHRTAAQRVQRARATYHAALQEREAAEQDYTESLRLLNAAIAAATPQAT